MKRYFKSLESLRGVAAVEVAVYHWYNSTTFPGYLAVDFFFILSGFVIAHAYLFKDKKQSFIKFLTQRIARLYPLHILSLLLFLLVGVFVLDKIKPHPDDNLYTFLQNILFIQNIGLNPSSLTWNVPSWSVCVEFWVNLIFFILIARSSRTIYLISGAIFFYALLYYNVGSLKTTYQNISEVVNTGMLRGMGGFLLGVLAYRAYNTALSIMNKQQDRLFSLLEFLAGASILFCFLYREEESSPMDFLAVFVFFAAIIIFSFERGIISKLIQRLRLDFLGKISYSIYLNHKIIIALLVSISVVNIGQHRTTFLALYLAIVIGYSHLTYTYIENPFRKALPIWLNKPLTIHKGIFSYILNHAAVYLGNTKDTILTCFYKLLNIFLPHQRN